MLRLGSVLSRAAVVPKSTQFPIVRHVQTSTYKNTLNFFLNGKKMEVKSKDINPAEPLLNYLRSILMRSLTRRSRMSRVFTK